MCTSCYKLSDSFLASMTISIITHKFSSSWLESSRASFVMNMVHTNDGESRTSCYTGPATRAIHHTIYARFGVLWGYAAYQCLFDCCIRIVTLFTTFVNLEFSTYKHYGEIRHNWSCILDCGVCWKAKVCMIHCSMSTLFNYSNFVMNSRFIPYFTPIWIKEENPFELNSLR